MKQIITFSCGHEEEVDLFGNRAEKERKLYWYEHTALCSECRERKEQQAMKHLEEKYSMPELKGTEKQVAWARKIRLSVAQEIDAKLKRFETGREEIMEWCLQEYPAGEAEKEAEKYLSALQLTSEVACNMLHRVDDCRFYIDNRVLKTDVNEMMRIFKETVMDKEEEESIPDIKMAKEEITLRPEVQTYEGTVEVKINDNNVTAIYTRNDTFRSIMKELKYTWEPTKRVWEKVCNEFSGNSTERGAELINKLLLAGFSVMCSDEETRQKGVNADYQPECFKWVKCNQKVFIIDTAHDDKLYYRARLLPGSAWSRKFDAVTVPVENWKEVEDFAEINDFMVSRIAKEVIEQKRALSRYVTPNKQEVEPSEDKLDKILESSPDVIEDLKESW